LKFIRHIILFKDFIIKFIIKKKFRSSIFLNFLTVKSLFQDPARITDIKNKYDAAGGFNRLTPSIEQVQNCIDYYLPTILTSEEPELFVESTNGNNFVGRIEGTEIFSNLTFQLV